MVGWIKALTVLLMLSVSYAAIVESGDNGKEFAAAAIAAKCNSSHVQAVYACIGNVVRVVSSVSGEGSTFYKPDGRVVECPVVSPGEMGAECIQLMTPNFCSAKEACGQSPAPETFPGQNGSPEQTGNGSYYIVEGQAAGDAAKKNVTNTSASLAPKLPNVTLPPDSANLEIPAVNGSNNIDKVLGYIVYIVAFLGIASVGVLFLLFKNSVAENE